MKVVVTGSLGHISNPLAQALVQKGHSVTVISSKPSRQKEIESIGATAAIGSIEDPVFLSNTFTGADIVYLMEPPPDFLDQNKDMAACWLGIAKSYVHAIRQSGITKVIHLSSIGGHTDKGVGMLATHHWVENILKTLPNQVSIKTMRPVGFYYNMLAFIPSIKNQNAIIQNYGGNKKEPWVSPLDIAAVIAEEIEKPFDGSTIRYIASDEASPNEVARLLGRAIGKPDLKWMVIPDEAFSNNLLHLGFSPKSAKGLTDMNAGRLNGLYDDYKQNKPAMGKIKLKDFAVEFAQIFKA